AHGPGSRNAAGPCARARPHAAQPRSVSRARPFASQRFGLPATRSVGHGGGFVPVDCALGRWLELELRAGADSFARADLGRAIFQGCDLRFGDRESTDRLPGDSADFRSRRTRINPSTGSELTTRGALRE